MCRITRQHFTSSNTDARIPYLLGTENYHHEMEFSVQIRAPAFQVSQDDAMKAVYGYCSSLDMTRRDLQAASKAERRPWDTAKDFEAAAVFGTATQASAFGEIKGQRLLLSLNDETRQNATFDEFTHAFPAIIADQSKFYHLNASDVNMTGTTAGVGPVKAGDVLRGDIAGLDPVKLTFRDPE